MSAGNYFIDVLVTTSNMPPQFPLTDRQVDVMAAQASMIVPDDDVMAHTAHLYKPETRRPYGILEWPAMLRLLRYEADERIPAFDS